MTVEFSPDPVAYLYQQVADHVEARIRAGDLPHGKPLPAEKRFAEEYGVSLGTMRHATRLLCDRGLVLCLPSKGMFVVDPATVEPRRPCLEVIETGY